MAVSTVQTTLPDPNHRIADSGWLGGGSYGPGFASVVLSSEQSVMKNRTNSGRLVTRIQSGHTWKISIKYNPLTRDEFEPVANFITEKRGSLEPFFVQLPQHNNSRNATFATWGADYLALTGNYPHNPTGAVSAGQTNFMADGFVNHTYEENSPKPGDIFTISGSNAAHTKAYKVTRVENRDKYTDQNYQPAAAERRIHFIPPLTKALTTSDEINFVDPKLRVISSTDQISYTLTEDNLYTFTLELEEAHR